MASLLKYVELCDSFIFIARRSFRQLSWLHVIHHSSVLFTWYSVLAHAPGGDGFWCISCNSLVHVVMYATYAMTSIGVPAPWRQWLTQMQLIQFVTYLAQAVAMFAHNDREKQPMLIAYMLAGNGALFLGLFANFYVHRYLTGKPKAASPKAKAE